VKMIDRHRDQISGTPERTSERRISAPSLEKISGGTNPSRPVLLTLQHCAACSTIIYPSTLMETMMRKPRDFDAELKALDDKARGLKTGKVRQLGELVIATGADTQCRRTGRCADRAGRDKRGRKEGGMGQARGRVLSRTGAAKCTNN
jgi:hypothetical protein